MKIVVYDTRKHGMPAYRLVGKEHNWTLDELLAEIKKANCKKTYYAEMVEGRDKVTFLVGDGEDLFFEADVSLEELFKEICRVLDVSYYRRKSKL